MINLKLQTPFILICCFLFFSSFLVSISLVQAQGATVSFSPSTYTTDNVEDEFELSIIINDVEDLWRWEMNVTWDPEILEIVSVSEGSFLSDVGSTAFVAAAPPFLVNATDLYPGAVPDLSSGLMSLDVANGDGELVKLTFQPLKEAVNSVVEFDHIRLKDNSDQDISFSSENCVVNLRTSNTFAHAGDDQTVDEGDTVTFDASNSEPVESLSFTWSFFDETAVTLEGVTADYTFVTPGLYKVQLTAEDSEEETFEDSIMVTVTDTTLPVPVISGVSQSQNFDINEKIWFDGSQSYDPENGSISSYSWDFGDGTISPSANPSHGYSKAGSYTVTLSVVDERSQLTASESITVNVGGGSVVSSSVSLPPIVVGILFVITVLTISGSAFWLRKTVA